jgi:hypothetical protein
MPTILRHPFLWLMLLAVLFMWALNGAKTTSTANSFLAAHVRNPLLPLENSGLTSRDASSAFDVRAETLNNTANSQISAYFTSGDAGTLNNLGSGRIYGDHVVTSAAKGGTGVGRGLAYEN